jgi:hypothetical protein
MRLELRLDRDAGPTRIAPTSAFAWSGLAEDAGFEPARGCPQHAFQACALGH